MAHTAKKAAAPDASAVRWNDAVMAILSMRLRPASPAPSEKNRPLQLLGQLRVEAKLDECELCKNE